MVRWSAALNSTRVGYAVAPGAFVIAVAVAFCCAMGGCPNRNFVGTTTCLGCHDGRSGPDKTEFLEGVHAQYECESCHGPGYAHVREGGRGGLFIENPAKVPFNEADTLCAQCHPDLAAGWRQTAHFSDQAATCHECHDVHKRRGMVLDNESGVRFDEGNYVQLCGDCHGVQAGQFSFSLHAILDVATCGSCHNMHAAGMFTANPTNNMICLQCHASFELGFDSEEAIDFHTGEFHPVDPAGTGASRCVGCHLPPLEQGGFDSDHTLFTVPPIASNQALDMGIFPAPPNSCAGLPDCHTGVGPGALHDANDRDSNVGLQGLYESIGGLP